METSHSLLLVSGDEHTGLRQALILLGMTAGTGMVDAVSFLALGRVFTANMTGNIVLLGFALAGTGGLSVARSSVALAGFLLGAVAGGRMYRWVGRAFLAEVFLLVCGAAAAIGMRSESTISPAQLYAVIAVTAAAMGLRNAVVRKLGVPDLTTTVLTLTITGLAADSRLAGGDNPRWQRRIGAILAMLVGAGAGARMVAHSISLPLIVCSAITAVCAFIQLQIDSKGRQA